MRMPSIFIITWGQTISTEPTKGVKLYANDLQFLNNQT